MFFLTAILFASWGFAHYYYDPGLNTTPPKVTATHNLEVEYDKLIDAALQYSLEGKYYDSAQILIPLAQQGVIRAQLYLAVAYYHGHGVERNRVKAQQMFFALQEQNYERGIVNTYLNLIGSRSI